MCQRGTVGAMKRLEKIRRDLGLTQAEAGQKVGVTHATFQRWEKGERGTSTDRVPDIAKRLGVHPGELFDEMPLPKGSLTAPQRQAAEIAGKLKGQALLNWLQAGAIFLAAASAEPPQKDTPSREPRRRSAGK
jgi:transcriptional regulator with XRE-family HTH domain